MPQLRFCGFLRARMKTKIQEPKMEHRRNSWYLREYLQHSFALQEREHGWGTRLFKTHSPSLTPTPTLSLASSPIARERAGVRAEDDAYGFRACADCLLAPLLSQRTE